MADFRLPTRGQTNWDDEINDSLTFVKDTAESAGNAASNAMSAAVTAGETAQAANNELAGRLSAISLDSAYAAKPDNGARAVGKGELFLNVKDYGAVGNNVANDATAFQSAIDAAAAAKMPLVIPGGHYKISSTLNIPSGLVLRGAGSEPTNGTPTRLNFSTLPAASAAMTMTAVSNVALSDFYLTGKTAGGTADEIQTLGHSRGVVIERVTINSSTSGAAFAFATAGGAGGSCIKSSVRNCTAAGSGYGFRVGNSSTSMDFAACYANACTSNGYLIQGTYISLLSCAADQNTLYGYLIQGAVAVALVGCGAENNGRTAFHCSGSKNVTIMGGRGVGNNTSANAAVPSFLGVNDASDYITAIGCADTTPDAASSSGVSSWQGTAPTSVTLLNNDFTAKPVHASLRHSLTTRVLELDAGTAARAPLRIPHGAAPTSPVNGDMWTTTAGLFVRINGATVGPLT